MKKFIASGFGVGLFWERFFGNKKGGGTLAPFLFTGIIYYFELNEIFLLIIFFVLLILYFWSVSDDMADTDPSWITLDEIIGMSLVSVASPSRLLPLVAGFIVFRASDILKQPKYVKDLENYPGRLGVLYDDLGAGVLGLLSATIVNQFIILSL